jgi:Tfp pilus assembly major pilin PilA
MVINSQHAEDNRTSYCKALAGNPLFSALCGTYAVTLIGLKAMLKVTTLASQTKSPKTEGEQLAQDKGFKDVHRHKWHNTDEAAQTSKKAAVQDKTSDTLNTLPMEDVTRNYFDPLRTADMDTDTSSTDAMPYEEAVPGKTGRPPPVVLTSATNLIKLQKQLKGVVKDNSGVS